ncbi:MAG: UDP-N-acetylglucosamine 2-epimerase (non-hydrolyzing) [Chitinophagales bacterium]|nr:UDP-N-acetylglucosamine 2-epimerase (non-hydrolyzing) [Chitinophagales bacterium]
MKILTILGARPQFIKAGSVSRTIALYPQIKEIIVHTGQHYDANMSDVFFEEMNIPKPNYNLGIGGKTHGAMTGQMIEKIEEVALKEKPDWILVYGDTNSTLAGALVAAKLHVKLAHVEAGLRSFNMAMPEEINRILTDRVSTILFCPTLHAVNNLKREGFDNFNCKIIMTGDVMYDGALFYSQKATKPNRDIPEHFILCTIHRAENTDNVSRLTNILEALEEIAQTKPIVLPLHPRTKSIIEKLKIKISENIRVIEPVGYMEMVWLTKNCGLVLTDSGGLQKEAYFFSKLCLTLRDETEWIELVDNNVNFIVGADKSRIVNSYLNVKFTTEYPKNLYGTGNASKEIVDNLISFK